MSQEQREPIHFDATAYICQRSDAKDQGEGSAEKADRISSVIKIILKSPSVGARLLCIFIGECYR